MRTNILVMLALVAFAVIWRLVPHPDNMTPVAAVALFAGARLSGGWRYLFPLGLMLLSDLLLGFHATMWFVYAAFLGGVFLGTFLRQRGVAGYAGMSVANSLLFFVVTNFGVWSLSGMYTPDFGGLLAAYVAAIPFLWKTLAGDLFFTLSFFALFSLVDHYLAATKPESLRAHSRG